MKAWKVEHCWNRGETGPGVAGHMGLASTEQTYAPTIHSVNKPEYEDDYYAEGPRDQFGRYVPLNFD